MTLGKFIFSAIITIHTLRKAGSHTDSVFWIGVEGPLSVLTDHIFVLTYISYEYEVKIHVEYQYMVQASHLFCNVSLVDLKLCFICLYYRVTIQSLLCYE